MRRSPASASHRVRATAATLFCLAVAAPSPLSAGNILHSYDALGRLTRVCKEQGDGERTDYGLDARDNRSGYINTQTDFVLTANSGKNSDDGRFTLWMQPDGNLVLYRNSDGHGIWATNTSGSGASVAYFQPDGNLVLYGSSGMIWNAGINFLCGSLTVQNNGDVVIRDMDGTSRWNSGPGGY